MSTVHGSTLSAVDILGLDPDKAKVFVDSGSLGCVHELVAAVLPLELHYRCHYSKVGTTCPSDHRPV